MEESSINFRDQFFKYLIHWKWFVFSVILFFIGAKLYLRYSISQYKITSTILIKDENSGGIPSELSAFKDLGLFSGSKNSVDDEIEILKSRSLIEKVIKYKDFNVTCVVEGRIKSSESYYKSPIKVFFEEKDEAFYKTDTTFSIKILSKNKFSLYDGNQDNLGEFNFNKTIKSKIGNFKIQNTNFENIKIEGAIFINVNSLKNTTDYFKAKLNVSPLNKFTNVIELSFIDPLKEKGEDFLNALTMFYNKDAISDKNLISEKTAKFIDERLTIITKELDGVEKEVEFYKEKNKITDLTVDSEVFLKTSSEFEKEAIVVQTQLGVVNLMIDYLKENKDNEVIPANIVPEDNNSASLIGEYNGLIVERSRLLKSSTVENPAFIRLNDKIENLKSSIDQSLKNYKSSLRIKSNDIGNKNSSIANQLSKLPKKEREFRGIYRQQQIKEELYLYLFKKREETAISMAITVPNAKIVDVAFAMDNPVSPNKGLIKLASIVLGFLLPFMIIYLLDLLDTKVKNRHDVESILKAPFIGDVPHSDSHNEIIQPSSRTSTAEAIRIVRTNLEFILNNVDEQNAKTIFLTSTLPKEGKTFIAINLAATIAISGKKTLLIGMDIRNPKLDDYVKLPSKGLTNFLSSNDADIKNFLVKQKGYEHFDILPAGIIPPNPAELLMSKKVDDLFNSLKLQYDYIVVDTAPVSLVTDTLLISKNADTFVYVVRSNYLEKALLKIPETFYKEKKLPNMCVLLNDTNSINGYGYGYGQEVVKKPWYKRIFSLAIFG